MNAKRIAIIVVAVTLVTLLASVNPALALVWDHQEKIQNKTGQDAYDLTKIVEFVETGAVSAAISNQLGEAKRSGGPVKWYIH